MQGPRRSTRQRPQRHSHYSKGYSKNKGPFQRNRWQVRC